MSSSILVVFTAVGIGVVGVAVGALLARSSHDDGRPRPARLPAEVKLPLRPSRDPDRRDEPRPPEPLIRSLASGECVLFAGAGVGATAGYPTWAELLSRTVGLLGDRGDPSWRELEAQIVNGEYQLVAEVLESRVDEDALRNALRAAYAPQQGARSGPLVGALSRLPVGGVITSAWDARMVIRAFRTRQPLVLSPEEAILPSAEQFFVLLAYGSLAPESEELILSAEDFASVVARRRDLALLLGNVLATRALLFVGTDIDGIEQFCAGARWQGIGQPSHFALVPDGPAFDLQRERMLRRYGVELIPLPADDVDGSTVRFIERTAQSLRMLPSPPADGPRHSLRLERIELENIGPFEQVAIDFETDVWATVLLGDNASGKTTILRAIAFALCGESSQSSLAPRDLLRSGASSGSITVWVGDQPYRTKLLRERNDVWVEAPLITPVQGGEWLAVGLPALRGVSLGRSMPDTLSGRHLAPSAEDLQPLVDDVIDGRMDDLEWWIAANWLASRDRTRPDARRRAALLQAAFEVFTSITPGFSFDFEGVDPDAGTVILRTEDGLIPMRLLSLGLGSILACVGVLLQRLHETYQSEDARMRPALLLVDELDAHLHPGWQRVILGLLREWFPGVQLIGTTHSPLVVGGAAGAQVLHIDRAGADPVSVPVGWRADQILTGQAFNLPTTLDDETSKRLDSYRLLLSRRQRSSDQERELVNLANDLRVRLPEPESTPVERQGAALFEQWLDERLDAIPDAERERIIREARATQASVRPKRRPPTS